MTNWLIYGANGYTGRLIARQAALQGLRPVLAGRGASVLAMADELGLQARQFDLADQAATSAGLDGVGLVLNCAGPFSQTAEPMIAACLQTGVHYLDITGEIDVFEHASLQHGLAEERGVVVCPGVGFDVVPTDCLAATLHAALPDADQLALGFDTASPLSPGTSKSLIEGLALGGRARVDGKLKVMTFAHAVRRIDFGFGEKWAMTIPWGDVSTAFHSTGIPNIECFIACPPAVAVIAPRTNWTRGLIRRPGVQRWLKGWVDRHVNGPDEEQRAKLPTAVWGEVRNPAGQRRVGRIRTANGYQFTVDAALAVVAHLLGHPPAVGGYYTPSRLCGPTFVEKLPGSSRIVITKGEAA